MEFVGIKRSRCVSKQFQFSCGARHFLREILRIARHVKHDRSGRKLSDVLAENREKLKDRPSRIKFSFNLVRHGSPTYSLLLLSSCLISAHFIGRGQSFLSESTPISVCVRERQREKEKINKEKILEIERIKEISILRIFRSRTILKIEISENFYFASQIKIPEKFYFDLFCNRMT